MFERCIRWCRDDSQNAISVPPILETRSLQTFWFPVLFLSFYLWLKYEPGWKGLLGHDIMYILNHDHVLILWTVDSFWKPISLHFMQPDLEKIKKSRANWELKATTDKHLQDAADWSLFQFLDLRSWLVPHELLLPVLWREGILTETTLKVSIVMRWFGLLSNLGKHGHAQV